MKKTWDEEASQLVSDQKVLFMEVIMKSIIFWQGEDYCPGCNGNGNCSVTPPSCTCNAGFGLMDCSGSTDDQKNYTYFISLLLLELQTIECK